MGQRAYFKIADLFKDVAPATGTAPGAGVDILGSAAAPTLGDVEIEKDGELQVTFNLATIAAAFQVVEKNPDGTKTVLHDYQAGASIAIGAAQFFALGVTRGQLINFRVSVATTTIERLLAELVR